MTLQPEMLRLSSQDVAAQKRAQLKALFPGAFSETTNAQGETIEALDFDKLSAELGTFTETFSAKRERYAMDWPGKKDALREIQVPSIGTLKPRRDESVNFDTTGNLFIEGDNLQVLKLLQKSYYGKVKMIYIDPPYNTGNEFIYPDNFTESLDTYLKYAGLVDDEGRRFSTNTQSEGRFHTKWLNMMYPRLYLARNLLKEDGVIFISIDDNEQSNLKKLCDEVFGEENFLGTILWKKKTNGNNMGYIPPVHDYFLVYAKEASEECLLGFPLDDAFVAKHYSNPDDDKRGLWTTSDLSANHKGPYFGILNSKTGETHYPPAGRYWVFNEEEVKRRIKDRRVIFGKNGAGRPVQKKFLSDRTSMRRKAESWWDSHGMNADGTEELGKLFSPKMFDHPKPSNTIRHLLNISTEGEEVILDFFAGTATTAHAVLDLNKKDGGNRKFIMVQLPEPTGEKSEAYKAGFGSIADIGKERVRRVIEKIAAEREVEGKEARGEERQPALGIAPGGADAGAAELDLGFKVLKLDKSNFKVWEGAAAEVSEEELVRQLELFVDHISPDATQEDILYELLLKAGFMPTERVEKLHLAGKDVFAVAAGALLICLEDAVTAELIDAVAAREPVQFICLDRAFGGNDQLKTNAAQTFAARNQGREAASQITFRTV